MGATVRRGSSAGGRKAARSTRAREQVKERESESRSEERTEREVEGVPGAPSKANVGYRLTIKRTDDAVRDAVGDYGSIEVSVSLHEDCDAASADPTFERLRASVNAKVEGAFDEILGTSPVVEEPEDPEDEEEEDEPEPAPRSRSSRRSREDEEDEEDEEEPAPRTRGSRRSRCRKPVPRRVRGSEDDDDIPY